MKCKLRLRERKGKEDNPLTENGSAECKLKGPVESEYYSCQENSVRQVELQAWSAAVDPLGYQLRARNGGSADKKALRGIKSYYS